VIDLDGDDDAGAKKPVPAAPVPAPAPAAPREPPPDYSKLGVRELKDLLTAAGINFQGATEKDDLIRLLEKTRARAVLEAGSFKPTAQWQPVPNGAALPAGLEVKVDLKTGCNYARLPPKTD